MFEGLKQHLKEMFKAYFPLPGPEPKPVSAAPANGPKVCPCGSEKLYHKSRGICRKCYRRERYASDPVYRAKTLAYQARYWERKTGAPSQSAEPTPAPPAQPVVPAERNAAIVAALRGGATYSETAETFGVTRERIRQLAKELCPEVANHHCANPYCSTRPQRFTDALCATCEAKRPKTAAKREDKPLCACGKKAVYVGTQECRACNKKRRYHEDPEYRARIKATAVRCRQRNLNRPPHRTFNPERAKRVVYLVRAGIAKDTIAAIEGVTVGTVEYYKRRYVDNVEQVQ